MRDTKKRVLSVVLPLLLVLSGAHSQVVLWQAKKDMPVAIRNSTAVACNGKIYVIGGYGTSGWNSNLVYDPISNTWDAKANMLHGRSNLAVVEVKGKIYAIGGDRWTNFNEVYDPLTDAWTSLSPMPTARQHIYGTALNNKIHIIGGLAKGNFDTGGWERAELLGTHEVYDPVTDTWSTLAPLPVKSQNVTLSVVNNGIYAIGGQGDKQSIWNAYTFIYRYDEGKDTWQLTGEIDLPFIDNALVIGDYVYFLSAEYPDARTSTISRYNVITKMFELCTNVSYVCNEAAFASFGDRLFVFGGATAGLAMNHAKVFEGQITQP